jgi:sugar (pentulose or hexulose) kinase
MEGRAIVVIDVGKTLTKLTLWDPDGTLVERRTRRNGRSGTAYATLDEAGIERWIEGTLREFARLADVGAIIPLSHGAAAAIVQGNRLACPALDYEEPMPAGLRAEYDRLRDPFTETGSPALPGGLNLGAQLYRLQALFPGLLDGDAIIMPWAQYWSWRLSGVPATEVTSLGCHTDLWHPQAGAPSRLSIARGWAGHFAPLRHAGEALGPLTRTWVDRTGLAADVLVYCGLHDSNAALLAARAFPEIDAREATVLSTGTWFVAMRSPTAGEGMVMADLDEKRDCLVNIDVSGKPIPSARFMGGREIETLTGTDTRRIDIRADQPELIDAVATSVAAGAMVLPTFAPGVGPFPHDPGRWIAMPADEAGRRAAISLYAALVADVSLDLVGTKERMLVEGRFAAAELFVRALATLRGDVEVYVAGERCEASFGALCLLVPGLRPPAELLRVAPLPLELGAYRDLWRRRAAAGRRQAAADGR